jgi:hypothetical protein
MAQEREPRGQNRQALYERRGKNPANLIGYLNTETREVYTAHGAYSVPQRPMNLRRELLRQGFTPSWVNNQAHERRMAAILSGDDTGDYTYYV